MEALFPLHSWNPCEREPFKIPQVMRLKEINPDFVFWGTLWGLSEIFVWKLLGILHVSMKAPIMAMVAMFFLAASSEGKPLKALYTAVVAISIKVFAGVYFFCSVWAVLSLAIAWELMRFVASRFPSARIPVYALSAPLGMLMFILYRNPDSLAIVSYAGVNGFIAFLLSIPAIYFGEKLGRRARLSPMAIGTVYVFAVVVVVIYGWVLKG